MCYPIFPNFKVITFKEWARKHKDHNKHTEVMEGAGRFFRWCICDDCNEWYYLGEIK